MSKSKMGVTVKSKASLGLSQIGSVEDLERQSKFYKVE